MSIISLPDALKTVLVCSDGTCCCIPRKSSVIIISIINLLGCYVDLLTSEACLDVYCEMRERVDTVRKLLGTMFQVANMLLLIASFYENATLMDVYVKCTLTYIVVSFAIAIYDFVVKTKHDGFVSLLSFLPEVAFLFVVSLCLPLVDLYKNHLYSEAAASEKNCE